MSQSNIEAKVGEPGQCLEAKQSRVENGRGISSHT